MYWKKLTIYRVLNYLQFPTSPGGPGTYPVHRGGLLYFSLHWGLLAIDICVNRLRQWCAGKCLTSDSQGMKALVCNTCHLPWPISSSQPEVTESGSMSLCSISSAVDVTLGTHTKVFL